MGESEEKVFNLIEYENWDKLSDETAKFILEQSEKYLSETIVAADVATNRAGNILQLGLGLTIGLIGYLVSDPTSIIGQQAPVISIIFLLLISIASFRVYRLYRIKPLGNRATIMINDEKTLHEKQFLVYIFNAIKTTEKNIVFNEWENGKRNY